MGNYGIYAINASHLFRSTSTGKYGETCIWLADIREDSVVERLFNVIAKGEEEWHIMLNEDAVKEAIEKLPEVCDGCGESDPYECNDCGNAESTAKEILARIGEITKEYHIPEEDVWGLTWVW